jgi:HEAT repeat protein
VRILIAIAVLVGLVGMAAVLAFGIYWATSFSRYSERAVRGFRMQPSKDEPIGVDDALADLAADVRRQESAARRLALTPVDRKNQAKVTHALEPLLLDPSDSVRDAAVDALVAWAGRDNVPALVGLLKREFIHVDEPGGMQERGKAMEILGRLKDPRAASALAPYLGSAIDGDTAFQALQTIGPAAETEVVKYCNDTFVPKQRDARRLLWQFRTKPSVILNQTLRDLQNKERRREALEYLEEMPPIEERRDEVVRAIRPYLQDQDPGSGDAGRAIQHWTARENPNIVPDR